jgi:hypothetical protein
MSMGDAFGDNPPELMERSDDGGSENLPADIRDEGDEGDEGDEDEGDDCDHEDDYIEGTYEVWIAKPGGVRNHLLVATGMSESVAIKLAQGVHIAYYRNYNDEVYEVMEKNQKYAHVEANNNDEYPARQYLHGPFYTQDQALRFCATRDNGHKRYKTGYELWINKFSDREERCFANLMDTDQTYGQFIQRKHYTPTIPILFMQLDCHCNDCRVRVMTDNNSTREHVDTNECNCVDCRLQLASETVSNHEMDIDAPQQVLRASGNRAVAFHLNAMAAGPNMEALYEGAIGLPMETMNEVMISMLSAGVSTAWNERGSV